MSKNESHLFMGLVDIPDLGLCLCRVDLGSGADGIDPVYVVPTQPRTLEDLETSDSETDRRVAAEIVAYQGLSPRQNCSQLAVLINHLGDIAQDLYDKGHYEASRAVCEHRKHVSDAYDRNNCHEIAQVGDPRPGTVPICGDPIV